MCDEGVQVCKAGLADDGASRTMFPSIFSRPRRAGMLVVLAVAAVVVSVLFLTPVHSLDDTEVVALKDMQLVWNPPGWDGVPSCSWPNITCGKEGHVVRLVLTSLYMYGPEITDNAGAKIPGTIGNLVYLRYLSLNDNSFTGIIPPSIGNLTCLEHLDLSFNRLGGFLPPTIGNLKNLTYLSVDGNSDPGPGLTGELPSELSQLTQLRALGVSMNRFVGTLPDLTGMTELRHLVVGFNEFWGGLEQLGLLPSLRSVGVNACQFSGPLPATMASNHLKSFGCWKNHLSGSLPDWVCSLPDGRNDYHDLSDNDWTCPLPSCCDTNESLQCGDCKSSN